MRNRMYQARMMAGDMTRRFMLSAFVVITFVAYVIHKNFTNPDSPVTAGADSPVSAQPAMLATPSGKYRDGAYTGPTINAYYGLVQVQATVQNGRLTNVVFLQYPNDRRTSIQINNYAMPYLQQEAIQAQSANVNLISGATLTSQAFYYSLRSALQTAQN